MANNQILASDYFLSGSLAAGWSPRTGVSKVQVISGSPNYTEPNTTGTGAGQIFTGISWPDHASEVTVKSLTQEGTTSLILYVRWSSSANQGYSATITNGTLTIYRFDSGTPNSLGTASMTVAANDVLAFQAAGSCLSYYQNGVRIAFFNDPTYTSGGYPGYAQIAATNINHCQVYSWRGYSLVQQDGVWTKQGIAMSPIAVDLASNAQGLFGGSFLYDTNPQILTQYAKVYKCWFSGGTTGSQSTYYAEAASPAGPWSRYSSAVISGYVGAMMTKVAGTYYSYSQTAAAQGTGNIALHTSADGLSWSLISSNVLAPGAGGSWDAGSIYPLRPITIIGGTWYALYPATNGGSGFPVKIGLVTSSDGQTWTKYSGNPVLPVGKPLTAFPFQAWTLVNGVYYMWITVGPSAPQQSTGAFNYDPEEVVRYSTTDFKTWAGPVRSLHHSDFYECLNLPTADSQNPAGRSVCAVFTVNGKTISIGQSNSIDGPGSGSQFSYAIAPAPLSTLVLFNEDGVQSVATDPFTSGAGALDGNWTTPTGSGSLQIVSGPYVEPSLTSTASTAVYTGSSFGQNQYSEITIGTLSGTLNASWVEALVLASSSALTYYAGRVSAPTATQDAAVRIYKVVAGAATQIGPTMPCTPNVGDVWRLSVIFGNDGFPVLSFFQNGALVIQVQDAISAPITSGSPGMGAYSSVAIADAQISLFAAGNANVIPAYPSSGGNFAGYGTDISASTEFTSHPAGEINSNRTSIFGTNRGSRIIG